MATIKSYTSLEQSRKLAEILPLESADMYYSKYDTIHANMLYGPCDNEYFDIHEYIPCWSLAALLDILPDNYIDVDDTIKHPNLMKTEDGRYMIIYSAFQYTSLYSYPVNACVEMIIKLKERNLL